MKWLICAWPLAKTVDLDQMPCSVASDQGLHCLLFKIKMIKYTRHPYIWKWTHPIDKAGKAQWANMG